MNMTLIDLLCAILRELKIYFLPYLVMSFGKIFNWSVAQSMKTNATYNSTKCWVNGFIWNLSYDITCSVSDTWSPLGLTSGSNTLFWNDCNIDHCTVFNNRPQLNLIALQKLIWKDHWSTTQENISSLNRVNFLTKFWCIKLEVHHNAKIRL